MSKPFDYSKWDKIELSDDEEDVHPNIDKESWFRMKHRSRVEREEHENKDRKRLNEEIEKTNQRIKLLERDLKKMAARAKDDDDSDDDDDIDGVEAIKVELKELREANAKKQATIDDYDKNKKWNVDNMFTVKDERTMINPNAPNSNYTPTGYAKATTDGSKTKEMVESAQKKKESEEKPSPSDADSKPAASKPSAAKGVPTEKKPEAKTIPKVMGPSVPPSTSRTLTKSSETIIGSVDADPNFAYSYHEFTERFAEVVEEFMTKTTLEESKEFLLKNGEILLQEHAANYLLLASLEDEMNGYREKMKQTAKQSQIVSNIAELAKSMQTHPGNVIMPFFSRMEQREFLMGFLSGVDAFVEKIIRRAVTKRMEIDRERSASSAQDEQGVDLADVPREERLGPGGLDPLEVIESLPIEMQKAFESRDVDILRQVISDMDPKEAEYHMKRCVDSGLWTT